MDEYTLHDIPAYEAGTYQVIVVGARPHLGWAQSFPFSS